MQDLLALKPVVVEYPLVRCAGEQACQARWPLALTKCVKVKVVVPHLARLRIGTPAQAPGALVQPRQRLAKAIHRPAQGCPVR